MQRNNILYMILRVVFLLLPGPIIALALILAMQGNGMEPQLVVSGIAGLVAGLLMEVGTYLFLPLVVIHILSWVLYGIVLAFYMDLHSNIRQGGLRGVKVTDTQGAFDSALHRMDQADGMGRWKDTEDEKSINGRP